MSYKARKEEIVKEMRANDRVVQGIEDRLINLGHYQQYALEQTFGKESAPRKTFGDLVPFYYTLDRSFNLGLFDEVFSLRVACDYFEKETQLALKDVDDRCLIRSKIERFLLRNPSAATVNDILKWWPVLFDVRLEKDGRSRDFDTIILTSGGVVIMEFRTPDRNVSIDAGGNYITFYYQDARIEKYNLREKLEADKALISDLLQDHGVMDVPIIPLEVFCGKLAYSNLCNDVKTIRERQLCEFLDEMCSQKILDSKALHKINAILQECREELPESSFPSDTPFVEAYADLRSRVEAKIRGESVVEDAHRIDNEADLLNKASREDVRDFLADRGIEEEMAFQMSERVRKGHVHVRGWTKEMAKAMDDASIPDWFREGCKKIAFLSKRSHYCEPTLVEPKETPSEEN